VIKNATVTLVSSTGGTSTATTDDQGSFLFNDVTPGTYTLRVSLPGYQTYETQNLVVTSGQTSSVYVELKGAAGPSAGMKSHKALVIWVIAGAAAGAGAGIGLALSGGKKTVSPSTIQQ
jgi:hypothetical protein